MVRPAAAVGQATLHIAGGFTGANLSILKSTSYGASILVGGGVNIGQRISVLGEYSHASILSSAATIGGVFIPESSVGISSLTLNLKARIPIRDNLRLYVIGGYGLYYQQNLALGPGRWRDGQNIGAGMEYKLDDSVSLFWELRMHRIPEAGQTTITVPISFGVRWH